LRNLWESFHDPKKSHRFLIAGMQGQSVLLLKKTLWVAATAVELSVTAKKYQSFVGGTFPRLRLYNDN
jgi:hypothetical protein